MGGSSDPPQTTQETKQVLSPEQQAIMGLALPYAQQYASTPIQQYQGSGIVGLNATEQAAAQQMGQGAQAGGALATQAGQTQSKLLDPSFMLDVANNPYLQAANQVTTADMTRNLNENILPSVRSGATQAGGMYSGGATRQGIAEGQAIGRTSSAISDAITRANYGQYQQGLTQMQGAVNANSGVMGQQLFQPGVMSAIGAQERSLEQAKLDEQIRQFYTGQALPFLQAQELMSLVQGMPGGSTVTTATGALPKGPGFAQSVGGGAMSGAAIGSAVPGIGTGIGAGAGAGIGLLSYLTGNK
jgi:hypothetical protein